MPTLMFLASAVLELYVIPPQKVGMHFLLSEEGSICFKCSCAYSEKDELTSYNILPLGLK